MKNTAFHKNLLQPQVRTPLHTLDTHQTPTTPNPVVGWTSLRVCVKHNARLRGLDPKYSPNGFFPSVTVHCALTCPFGEYISWMKTF